MERSHTLEGCSGASNLLPFDGRHTTLEGSLLSTRWHSYSQQDGMFLPQNLHVSVVSFRPLYETSRRSIVLLACIRYFECLHEQARQHNAHTCGCQVARVQWLALPISTNYPSSSWRFTFLPFVPAFLTKSSVLWRALGECDGGHRANMPW
jgi:hypothetical protein